MRSDTLIMIYRMYVRPIIEFGCVLFSGGAKYKIRPLVLLEREALRICLGLPKFVANNVLYQEARLPSLHTRFCMLTVQTYLRAYERLLDVQNIYLLVNQIHFLRSRGLGYIPHRLYLCRHN